MTGAFFQLPLDWLNKVFEFLWQFVPKPLIVDTRCMALRTRTIRLRDLLRFRWDSSAKLTVEPPGFYVYWPLVTELHAYPTAYQTAPLVAQDVVTAPDAHGRRTTITARGMLAFEITDLENVLGHTYDPDDTIRDIAATAFHDVLCHQSYEALCEGQGSTLGTKMRNAAKKALADRGVLVHGFTLHSLAPTRVLRVVQSTSQEGEK